MLRRLDNRVHLAAEAGQSLVEFVLVLPLVILILFGIVDFAMSMNYWNDLNQIAGSGARRAAVNHDTSFNPVTYICDSAEPAVRRTLTVAVTFPSGTTVGSPVQVTTSATHGLLHLFDELGGRTAITMTGKATMRLEAPASFAATGPTACS